MGDITVRVGQQNAIKVISSISGVANSITHVSNSDVASYAYVAGVSTNVIGGVGILSTFQVTGISTFYGNVTFNDNTIFDNPINYINGIYNGPNGVAYFNNSGNLVSSPNTNSYQSNSSYILTVDSSGNPIWTDTITGGNY
jgi:hypothetical protein